VQITNSLFNWWIIDILILKYLKIYYVNKISACPVKEIVEIGTQIT